MTPHPPDLSACEPWLSRRDAAERKRRGQWVTPWWVCEAVVDRLAPTLGARPIVVDPACGDARWLVAVAQRIPRARLVGYDTDPLAIEAARATLLRAGVTAELHCADALSDGALPAADAIVGNPPFVRPQHLERAVADDLWKRFSVATNKSDLYACFVERALDRAPRVALVIPTHFLSLTSFSALRRRILDAGVNGVFALPRRAFPATVDTVALLCGPGDRRQAGVLDEGGMRVTGRVHVGPDAWSIDGALPQLRGAPLGEAVRIHMGIVCGDYPRYVHEGRRYPEDQPSCRGRDVQRWRIAPTDLHVRYAPRDMLTRKPYVAPKHAGLFDVPLKIVLAGTSGTALRAAMDTERRFPMDSCYVLHPRHDGVDPWAVLGLLLSGPVGDWYGSRFKAARVKGVEVQRIPAPTAPWNDIADAARAEDEAGLNAAVRAAYTAG